MVGKIDGLHLRTMTSQDIDGAMFLVESADWNQTPLDWQMILHTHGTHLVAVTGDVIIGTICGLNYGEFVWVAMVLVHPKYRRQGVATLLMEKIAEVYPQKTLRLDATENGARVYEKLGYRPLGRIFRWQMHASEVKKSAHLDGSISFENVVSHLDFLQYDHQVFGADRSVILTWLAENYPGHCLQIRASEKWSYLLGRPGTQAWQIGPVVADHPDGAEKLLVTTLTKYPQQAFFIDTFADHAAWHQRLSSFGFVKQRTFVRMQLGSNQNFGQVKKQFAIGGPELG
jgi:GNAT superfamily N-acetyltransferase